MASLADSSKVVVKTSTLGGAGAFAAVDIKQGEMVEFGLMRRLVNCDGNENPFCFCWGEDGKTWAMGAGFSMLYNTVLNDGDENCKMTRFFDEDRFEIHSLRDITAGEELTHLYKSKAWRKCFAPLRGETTSA